jgi:hypothetical protein
VVTLATNLLKQLREFLWDQPEGPCMTFLQLVMVVAANWAPA